MRKVTMNQIAGVGLAVLLGSSGLMAAPTPKSADDKAANSVSHGDQSFVIDAYKGGAAEVRLGQLAATKGTNTDVKSFGQHMATDHAKANQELKSLADKKGIKLENKDSKADSDLKKLSALSGADFDKQYMDMMVKDHKDDVSAFQKEANKGNDSNVKAWATKTLPTLQSHLKMAEAGQAKVGKKK